MVLRTNRLFQEGCSLRTADRWHGRTVTFSPVSAIRENRWITNSLSEPTRSFPIVEEEALGWLKVFLEFDVIINGEETKVLNLLVV